MDRHEVHPLFRVVPDGVHERLRGDRDLIGLADTVRLFDPDTGEVLPDGEEGELVFTSLTKQAMPVIRYRTRDLTRLLPGSARSMRRMDKITGRSDDMLIIRGVNVFPSQVEHVLLQFQELEPQYVIYVDRAKAHLDTLEVWVEGSEALHQRGDEAVQALSQRIMRAMRETLFVSTLVKIVAPGLIERSGGKARRVVDRRELG